MKKILIAAGTGISVSALDRLDSGLKKRGLSALCSVTRCRVPELEAKAPAYDILIRTAFLPKDLGRPVINGLGLVTGGAALEAVLDEIEAALKAQD
jgi:PTS system galactitol-specific IIB component